jgi:hypothetical protein
MDTVSIVSVVFGILGFSSVIFGFLAFYDDLKKHAREKDLGRIYCDKDEMGYFVIKKPSLWKPFRYFKRSNSLWCL